MRPVEVMPPISPRAVVATREPSTSCLVRAPESSIGSRCTVRATWPVAESSTQHGSSAISRLSGAALPVPTTAGMVVPFSGVPDSDSSSTVRRGVANFSPISASSEETSSRSTASESRMARSSSIAARSSSASFSSSMREKRVSWRRRSSRMWLACSSDRS